MKTSPRRRKHRRRAFRRLFWLLVLATLLLLLWPRRVTLDGLNSPHAILLQADSGEVLAEKDADSTIYPASMTKMMTALLAGCGRGRSGENTASVVMTGSVSTVDPAYAATPAERTLVLHLFDNLYRLTDEGAVSAAAQPGADGGRVIFR